MSMNAIFVQIDDAEIARFEADPDSVETLFADQTLPTAGLLSMTAAMHERMRALGFTEDPQFSGARRSVYAMPDP